MWMQMSALRVFSPDRTRAFPPPAETNFNNIPGWRLPRLWLHSMPATGVLRVTYTSLEPNCDPVWAERRRQSRRVLTYC